MGVYLVFRRICVGQDRRFGYLVEEDSGDNQIGALIHKFCLLEMAGRYWLRFRVRGERKNGSIMLVADGWILR